MSYTTTWTIKGLYIGGIFSREDNPNYYGTLEGAIRYANTICRSTHYGDETIEICVGDKVYARQEWKHGYDEAGEYYEPKEWDILVKN